MGWITRARDRAAAGSGGRAQAGGPEQGVPGPDVPVRVGAQAPQSEFDAQDGPGWPSCTRKRRTRAAGQL